MMSADLTSDETDEYVDRLRFGIRPDGAVTGDDGTDGYLAASVRYAARMARQMADLALLGELQWVTTVGRIALRARTDHSLDGMNVEAELSMSMAPLHRSRHPHAAGVPADVIAGALQWLDANASANWCAVMSDDKRLVGLHSSRSARDVGPGAVHEVGLRALALLGALEQPYRDIGTVIGCQQGDLLVLEIGSHTMYAQADRFSAELVEQISFAMRERVPAEFVERAQALWRPADASPSIADEAAVAEPPTVPVPRRRRRTRSRGKHAV